MRDVVAVAILSLCVAVILGQLTTVTCARDRAAARRIRCRDNLRALARGMFAYSDTLEGGVYLSFPLGRGVVPHDFTGAEWLASLYWTGFVPESETFLCPVSTDDNHGGADLGRERAPMGRFGPTTVSYAGLHYATLTSRVGSSEAVLPRHSFPESSPMACDDTEGPVNHARDSDGGMNVAFFDGHVQFRTGTQLDVEKAVGLKGGLLEGLGN